MKTVICTTGTSIAGGCRTLAAHQRSASTWDSDAGDLPAEIAQRLAQYDLRSDRGRIEASAELNSLHRLCVSPDDRIVLLATDTADGRACAEGLQRAVEKAFGFPNGHVTLHRVRGLQVRNAERLRTEGLREFIDTVLAYVENPEVRYGSEIVLNPTGGFKGVVPFLAVIGMLFRLRTVYVFEHSDALISLPPLPLTFDLHLYERAAEALSLINRETAVRESDYFSAISGFQEHERDLFAGFVEPAEGGLVTLSPIAFVLLRMDQGGGGEIRLSSQAEGQLKRAAGVRRVVLENLLGKLAHPLWRAIHTHSFAATDLETYKPGGVSERAAGVSRGNLFYVCCLYGSHDEYERDLPGRKRSQFDLSSFVRWSPPVADEPGDDRLHRAWEVENDELRSMNARLQKEVAEKRSRVDRQQEPLRLEIKRLRGENKRLSTDLEALTGAGSQMRSELEALRARISEMQSSLSSQPHEEGPG